MIATRILSINPSLPTEGSLHPEALERPMRIGFQAPSISLPKAGGLSRFLFGVTVRTGKGISLIALALRTLLAVCIGYMAMSVMSGEMALPALIIGGVVLSGFFSRFVSAGIAGMCGYEIAMHSDFTLASIDPVFIMTAVTGILALVLVITGPGKLSGDYAIVWSMWKARRRRSMQRKSKPEIPFSYKAYSVASRR